MKQLRITTSKPCSMFKMLDEDSMQPLILPESVEELINFNFGQGKRIYLHGELETIAGFDIPYFIDGDLYQLQTLIDEQDILLLLPSGEYKCTSRYTEKADCYLIELKEMVIPEKVLLEKGQNFISVDKTTAINSYGDYFTIGEEVGHEDEEAGTATILFFEPKVEESEITVHTTKGHSHLDFIVKLNKGD